ncbi:MAG: cardiolipin synthase B [Limnobacter sp.]|nr:cardiolipin synthase B [Limnobacter sp.]
MRLDRDSRSSLLLFAQQALSRAAGAPLVAGNCARILRDATENYPAWLQAIRGARSVIHFENYIIANDPVGREFAEALAERARAGVRVRVIHDWMGGLGSGSRRLLASVAAAGAEVRLFNPPRFDAPFGWLSRDHRKMMSVDGEIGFVSGLCVSAKWAADPETGREPWRDTGVEIRGPAVADIDRAFAETWAEIGAPLPPGEPDGKEGVPAPVGKVSLRVLASVPNVAAVYRLDQLIASMAKETLWLTDAYFVGIPPYVQALRAAAADGVDVRLLVPGASDLPIVASFSRTGYRPLLEAGVRVFEWNGPMLHAKTAVADGKWARIGSSNLNLASWIGNYELDVAVEDRDFAEDMERMFEEDLANATEILLSDKRRVHTTRPRPRRHPRRDGKPGSRGSAGRAAAGALRIGNTVGAAITNRRILGPAEAGMMNVAGAVLLLLSGIAILWPRAAMFPLAAIGSWLGISFLVKGYRLRSRK